MRLLAIALVVVLCGFWVVGCSSGSSGGAAPVTSSTLPAQGPSGSRAGDYLTAVPNSTVLVEVDFLSTAAPDQNALNLLQSRIQERCNKPNGVTLLVDDSIPSSGVTTWSLSAIRDLEAQHRDAYTAANQAVLYVLYLDGGSDQDTGSARVLGLSYSGSSFCVFKDSMRSAAVGAVTLPVIEGAVLVHELGHNLGLVNNGAPMQTAHQDTANGAHDVDSNCVMHHSIESSLISQILGTVPNQFGANCVQDLQAAGGQ